METVTVDCPGTRASYALAGPSYEALASGRSASGASWANVRRLQGSAYRFGRKPLRRDTMSGFAAAVSGEVVKKPFIR